MQNAPFFSPADKIIVAIIIVGIVTGPAALGLYSWPVATWTLVAISAFTVLPWMVVKAVEMSRKEP